MSQAGPVNILNGIDLKIAKGETIGLVGPSGSGKSTMLMVMSGLERPTSGKVTVAGKELSKFDEDAAARFRRGNVGIVFQSFHLIPTMTALENVAVPLELALVPNAFERAAEELKAVGLAHRMDHYPSQLSGGEQQRVALARAIAPRPNLLFADEPTGNLDGKTGSEIMNLIFALQRERGATLVLVTHDEDLVRRCDRIVRLRDGRIDGIETIEQTSAPIPMAGPMAPVVTMAATPIPVPIAKPEPAATPAPLQAEPPAPVETPEAMATTSATQTEPAPPADKPETASTASTDQIEPPAIADAPEPAAVLDTTEPEPKTAIEDPPTPALASDANAEPVESAELEKQPEPQVELIESAPAHVEPEPSPSEETVASAATDAEPVSEPLAASAPVEIKPDPELSREQIESDLGIGITDVSEVEVAAPRETASAAEIGGDAETATDEAAAPQPTDDDYRRVAAGGE